LKVKDYSLIISIIFVMRFRGCCRGRGEAHGDKSNIGADHILKTDGQGDGVWRSQDIVEVPVSAK